MLRAAAWTACVGGLAALGLARAPWLGVSSIALAVAFSVAAALKSPAITGWSWGERALDAAVIVSVGSMIIAEYLGPGARASSVVGAFVALAQYVSGRLAWPRLPERWTERAALACTAGVAAGALVVGFSQQPIPVTQEPVTALPYLPHAR